MGDIMNVTSPVQGQETINRPRPDNPNQGNSIHQVPDPSRVPKSQDQTVQADRQRYPFSPNLESNFEKFVQSLRDSPELVKTYVEIFYSKLGNLVQSGLGEGFTNEIAQYMDMLKMTDAELLKLLQSQQGMGTKYHGPVFDLMRELIHSGGPDDMKTAILDFLRKYDNLTSSNHLYNNIVLNLKNIALRMPHSVASNLNTMIGNLNGNLENGEQQGNLAILKEQIMPFLSQYISATKDFSTIRDLITMLTLNLARYESGTKEGFMDSFRQLLSYAEVGKRLEGINIEAFGERLMGMKNADQANGMNDKLVSIISKGINGEAGYQNKTVFQNIMNSVLLNESVYMPLLHVMLPADIEGRMFFSEAWIDPDDQSPQKREGEGRAVRLLVKFDIRSLGYFELVMFYQNGKVDLELLYPESLEAKRKDIQAGMAAIMEKNQLSFQSLILGRCEKPKTVTQVFPKIFERKNTINVTI